MKTVRQGDLLITQQDSSTKRIYYLRVPPSMETAKKSVAWSFGLEEQNYQPEKQT